MVMHVSRQEYMVMHVSRQEYYFFMFLKTIHLAIKNAHGSISSVAPIQLWLLPPKERGAVGGSISSVAPIQLWIIPPERGGQLVGALVL